METIFELLIPRRPKSLQAKNAKLQQWKSYVRDLARTEWNGPPHVAPAFRVTLVYLCDVDAADIDNIIKPIQDALVGVVMPDDNLVSDVDSHGRLLDQAFDLTDLPALLVQGAQAQRECVYVRVLAGAVLPLTHFL